MSATTLKGTRLGRRQFYPAVTKPTAPELSQHNKRKSNWFPIQKQIWKKTTAYQAALNYLSRPHYKKQAFWVGFITLSLGLGSWWLFTDPFTKAVRTGYTKANGEHLNPASNIFVTFLAVQGALSVLGFMFVAETKKRNGASLTKERYEEWLRRQDVTQEDLQRTLLPKYDAPHPYDPSNPDINFVLGEYYDNDAHKFGPVAHWYVMRMKGLQTGGMIIFGVTGAGKTSSILRPIMRQAFGWMAHVSYDPDNRGREKTAGFVLDPKGSLAVDTRQVLMTAGMDPILDPLQDKASDPKLTPLIHLLHDGKDTVDPAVLAAYRGREDDYLELGYDELRVNRIWDNFQLIQTVAKRLVGEYSTPTISDPSERTNFLEGAEVRITGESFTTKSEDGTSSVTVSFNEGAIQILSGSKAPMPRRVILASRTVFRQIPWNAATLRHGDAIAPLYRSMDGLMQSVFLGRNEPSPQIDSGARGVGLEIHPQIPGLLYSTRNALEAFAATRNLVRRFAPAKQSPVATLREYRAAWLLRESRMWEFSEVQVVDARRTISAARVAAIDARLDYEELPKATSRESEAFASQVIRDVTPLITPLQRLLGDGAVAPEYARPKVTPSDLMRAVVDKVKTALDHGLASRLASGDFLPYTVPTSEVPKPHPVDKATEDRLKGRYSAPDPVVLLVQRAGELREREGALTDRLLAAAGQGFKAALAEVEFVTKSLAEEVSNRIKAQGGAPPEGLETSLGELASAMTMTWGGSDGLAADLVATHLGMAALPAPGVDFHRLAALGGKAQEFAAQALSASRFLGMDHDERLAQAADAVAEGWVETAQTPGPVLRAILKSSRMEEARIDQSFQHLQVALKGVFRSWVTSHMAALEEAMESPALRAEALALCDEGLTFAKDLDPIVMGGGVNYDSPDGKIKDELPWFRAIWTHDLHGKAKVLRHGPFWRGPMGGRDMTPLHASQWDPVWGKTAWTLLSHTLTALPTTMALHITSNAGVDSSLRWIARRGAMLGEYHCSCLESFRVTVAPNIAWRTDGCFAFNPLYAPDLAAIVIAGTFNDTAFEATSDGKDSSDPFWQNASFSTVFNILQVLTLVDGYATFPRIDTLVTNEEILREYLDELRDRLKNRQGRSEDMETISNILKWADGEWLTAASAKSETKDNIIRSLSVVTQPFKEPKFSVCFAPSAKEDISFPSFTWVMREGKIVACNLPYERYEKVAKVVLPLANKNFQKAVQMRDGVRGTNAEIVKRNRGEIKGLHEQAANLRAQIQNTAAEVRVLEVFFSSRKGPGDHLLGVWSAGKDTNAILRRDLVCMGDAFMSPARLSALKRDALVGFVLGATRKTTPYDGLYLASQPSGRAGIEAGFFCAMLNKQGGNLSAVLQEGPAAKRLVEAIRTALSNTRGEEGNRNLWSGSDADLDHLVADLPAVLLQPVSKSLGRDTRLALVAEFKRLSSDHRSSNAEDASAMAAGQGSLPTARLGQVTAKIRALEDEIAEMPNTERPVVYMVDEAQRFVQQGDPQYVAVSRSCNALNFYSTQSPNALMARLDEAKTKQFLDNLPNRVILRMPDSKSAESCAEYLGGKKRFQIVETNVSQNFKDVRADTIQGGGRGQSEGGSVSVSMKEEERWVVDLQAIVNLQAMEAYAMVWDGKKNTAPRRIYTKPDYLYTVPEIRSYKRMAGTRYGDLPKEYPEGMDLYALTVPRLLELGVIDASR